WSVTVASPAPRLIVWTSHAVAEHQDPATRSLGASCREVGPAPGLLPRLPTATARPESGGVRRVLVQRLFLQPGRDLREGPRAGAGRPGRLGGQAGAPRHRTRRGAECRRRLARVLPAPGPRDVLHQ